MSTRNDKDEPFAAIGENRKAKDAQPGFIERTGSFISATRAEMRRVTWPSATEVKNTTIITLIAVIFFAIYLFIVDRSFTLLVEQLGRFVGWLLGAAA